MKMHCFCLVAAGLLLAADDKKDDAVKKDLEKFQGSWRVTAFETDGQGLPEEELKKMKMVFKGDKYTFTYDDMTEKGAVVLDPSKKAAEVDLKIQEGNDAGKTQVGLYKIDGDSIKFCLGHPGEKDRPKEIPAKSGDGQIIVILKRDLL